MADATDLPSDRDRWLDELSRNHGSYRERLAQGLCRTFRNYKLQLHEAEDIADKALVKAVENIAQFDPATRPFYVWLHMIAKRCALDYVQSAERCRATVNVNDLDTRREPPSHPDPAEVYRLKRLASIMQDEIAKLPRLQGEAVRLARLEEMSHAEAAKELGVPIRRFREALYLGLRRLRRSPALRKLHDGSNHSPKNKEAKQGRARRNERVLRPD